MALPSDDQTERDILAEEQARFFGQLLAVRVALLPVFAGALLALAALGPVGWQARLLATLALLVPAFFVFELLRYRRCGFSPGAIPLNLGAATVGQLAISAATGGLLSPFIYGAVVIAFLLGAVVRRGQQRLLSALQIGAVWAFAALGSVPHDPQLGGGLLPVSPAVDVSVPPAHHVAHGVVLSFALLGACRIGRASTGVFSTAIARIRDVQRDLLAEHGARIRELTALSAEIAHELKNPLASVKGLSALLAQNLQDGRAAERLAVLRSEVDRMQSILNEFLNFSRPLVPLAVLPSDAGELCSEVVALHEGLARSHGVKVTCEVQPAALRCDPRKVKQVLINLVQNALEASAPGDAVVLRTEQTDSGVRILVIDKGQGLGTDLDGLFEPGVSSKSGGAGIGLTIARGLARQHGGELTLSPRDGGGCIAELRLPLAPPGESV